MQPDPLDAVRRASTTKTRAERDYRSALVAALAAGASYADVARAAGVSRQAVRQLARRAI